MGQVPDHVLNVVVRIDPARLEEPESRVVPLLFESSVVVLETLPDRDHLKKSVTLTEVAVDQTARPLPDDDVGPRPQDVLRRRIVNRCMGC